MIAIGGHEHLRLMPQTAKGDGVDDPVAVSLKHIAGAAHLSTRFGMKAATAAIGEGGIGGKGHHALLLRPGASYAKVGTGFAKKRCGNKIRARVLRLILRSVLQSGLQSDCIGSTALDYWFYAISEPSDDSI
jgi:hypothetical protein